MNKNEYVQKKLFFYLILQSHIHRSNVSFHAWALKDACLLPSCPPGLDWQHHFLCELKMKTLTKCVYFGCEAIDACLFGWLRMCTKTILAAEVACLGSRNVHQFSFLVSKVTRNKQEGKKKNLSIEICRKEKTTRKGCNALQEVCSWPTHFSSQLLREFQSLSQRER